VRAYLDVFPPQESSFLDRFHGAMNKSLLVGVVPVCIGLFILLSGYLFLALQLASVLKSS